MFKKIITSVVLCATLASVLAVPAVAGTIAGCTPGVDSLDEMLCSKLQSIYGTTSNIEFSKTETEVCKYSTSVEINGIQTTVFLSQKPTSGSVGVQMGSNGQLVIDGIQTETPSDDTTTTGDIVRDPALLATELIKQFTHTVSYEAGLVHPFIEAAYPYNQINEKFVYAFGENCENVRYFLADDMDEVKAFLKENSIDVKVFLNEHFHKVKVNIGLQTKTVYVNVEPTKDQKLFLKSEAAGLTMVDTNSSNTSAGEVFIGLVLLANTAILGGLFYFLVWKRKDQFFGN